MKTKFLLIVLFITGIFFRNCFAQQAHLTISQINNFPVLPSDTAKEGLSYNLTIIVLNLDSSVIQVSDTMRIILENTDTTLIGKDTLASFYIDSLYGNDLFTITDSNYHFTPARYKAGNNIVVVWPRVINSIVTYDSLFIDSVYFVPLAAGNILSIQKEAISLFPNPVVSEISFNHVDGKFIEYVRILNDIGQEIMFLRSAEKQLNVQFLSQGFYFIEIKERNGVISRRKFLKL